MVDTRVTNGIAEVSEDDWRLLVPAGRTHHSHRYLAFRECVEPGEAVLAIARDQEGPVAAFHGAYSTPRSGLFSNVWKLLGSEQFLRLTGQPEDGGVTSRHRELAGAVTGSAVPAGAPVWRTLDGVLGPAVVLRDFDTTEALIRDSADPARGAMLGGLVDELLRHVSTGPVATVAFPFVRPGDTLLRGVLRERGFCVGRVTATTSFDLVNGSYEDFLATVSPHARRHHRKESRAFTRAGLTTREVPLSDHLDRIVELEMRNAAKHGGEPDRRHLMDARSKMSRLLGPWLRTPVVEHDDRIVACSISMVGQDDYCGLVFGRDYGFEDSRGLVYPVLGIYDPIRYCLAHGISRFRLGFESFGAKMIRGATLESRETWIWTRDERRRRAIGALLAFLESRSEDYFRGLVVRNEAP